MVKWLETIEDRLYTASRGRGRPWGPLLQGLRFPLALVHDWLADAINVQAMSLAYTTLLSIVPLIAFSIALLKALGTHANIALVVSQFLRPVGGAAAELTANAMEVVDNMRGDVLGTLGFVALSYTVVTTIQKVEASFQQVWRIERPRGLLRRSIEYLTAMIAGPILIAAALGVVASAQDSPLAHWLDAIAPLGHTLWFLGKLVPYALVTVVFTAMYFLIPNTRVKVQAAVIGGCSAGIIWALVGKLFTAFILFSSRSTAGYTGFAVVLTTLIWIYLSWLILLLGAQLAYYIQFPQYLRRGRDRFERSSHFVDAAALQVMVLVGGDYGAARPAWAIEDLATRFAVSASALTPIVEHLQRAGLLVPAGRTGLALSRAPADIAVADILRAARGDAGAASAAVQELLAQIDAAVDARVAGRTLRELIAAA